MQAMMPAPSASAEPPAPSASPPPHGGRGPGTGRSGMAKRPKRRRQLTHTVSFPALALALPALGLSCPALADQTGPKISASLERHWTSNALDSEFAIADWYTLLRGSLRQDVGDD